jgi:hypothetical protein
VYSPYTTSLQLEKEASEFWRKENHVAKVEKSFSANVAAKPSWQISAKDLPDLKTK